MMGSRSSTSSLVGSSICRPILQLVLMSMLIDCHVSADVSAMEGEAEVANLSSLEQDLESGVPLALTERERDWVGLTLVRLGAFVC